MNHPRRFIWIAVIGLLLYFGLRLQNIDAIPLFIDETIAVERSANIADGTLLHHAPSGKFALPYYLLLFQPRFNAVWISRVSVAIWTCLGLAGAMAIAGRYGGVFAGTAAAAMLTFSPMLFLFDRFAIGDTMAHAAVTVWMWSLYSLFDSRKPNWSLVGISGILFIVCLLTKATTVMLLPLPVVMATIVPRWPTNTRIKATAAVYAAVSALWIPLSIALSSRELDYFGHYGDFGSSANSLLDLSRIVSNLSFMLESVIVYHGSVFMVCALVASSVAIIILPRTMLPIVASVVGFGFAVVWLTDQRLFARYFVPILPLFLVGVGIALSALSDAIKRRLNWHMLPVLVTVILFWVFGIALPFVKRIQSDPENANLFSADFNEYIRSDSSGFAIPELAEYLASIRDVKIETVVGSFVGCETLRLYLPPESRVDLHCPNVLSGDRRAKYLNVHLPIEADMRDGLLLVLENPGLVSRDELSGIDLTPLAEFPRPGNHSVIRLFSATRAQPEQ